ncbi:hypothetical protein CROQUDRAFT_58174 [Cronartium quercuum f. sp. fusiforme G11]|uniref:Uncharacterized protein n=1 Tax=Cronartium quercuum f. sp. fusiforme G11 TaxID=708437 RepID=A0A9P6NU90_9BASI|nr:hypothetical protein CROQUDRAFT_58174 [Cronartium quercuum f. sp. fusiforme G11]
MPSCAVFRSAFLKFSKQHGKQVAVTYVQVPLGLIVILFLAYLVDSAITKLPFTFPASVVLMIIFTLVMITLEQVSPQKLSKGFHNFFSPASNWVLGNMGLFFTSSFILIPKRDPLPMAEIGLLCALFVPSFIATWIGTVAICKLLNLCMASRSQAQDSHDDTKKIPNLEAGDLGPIGEGSVFEEKNQCFHLNQSSETFSDDDLSKLQHSSNLRPTIVVLGPFRDSPPTEFETRRDMLVQQIVTWFDPVVYLIIFLTGIPLFFTTRGEIRSLPLLLGTVVLAWIFSRRVVPRSWQMALHPILVTSAITTLAIWMFAAVKGMSLRHALLHYSTGSNYLVIIRNVGRHRLIPPGAGDVMNSILVAGIVCLAFPLFRYRQDLFNNFVRIVVVVIPNCAFALLLCPYLARIMGIDGQGALIFVGRFMSTPLGIEEMRALKGDQGLVVVLICVTGILAVLIRDHFFRLLRVRVTVGSEDYFTMGMTVGVVAAAIGTSSLLESHPRAAATASVSFVLYGLVLLSLVAIPEVVIFVRHISGL